MMSAESPRVRLIAVAVLLSAVLAQAEVQETTGVEVASARMTALGGGHVALADDLGCLFINPAGFRAAGPTFSFAEVTARVSGPIFTIASVIIQGLSGLEVEQLVGSPGVQSLLRSLYASVDTVGPVAFGYVGSGLGFGFFNTTAVTFSTEGVIPTVFANLEEDFLFSGGYAFRIPLSDSGTVNLDIGALLDAFVRARVSMEKSVLELFTLFQSPSLDTILGQSFRLEMGIGIGLGMLLSLYDVLYVGLVGRNLYAPSLMNDYASVQAFLDSSAPESVSDGIVPLELDVGLVYAPSLGFLNRYITDFKIMLDYYDALDFVTHPSSSQNPILHVGAGIEISVLEILAFRGGFAHGLFAAGLGIDLTYFTLNISMFGSELSSEPGLRPLYNLLLSLEFRY